MYGTYWQDNDEALWSIDPSTGNTTRIGTTLAPDSSAAFVQDAVWFDGARAAPAPIPVMSFWALIMMAGFLGFFGIRRLRKV